MTDTASEVAKIAPPASVGGLSLFSVPLNDWVLILTVLYTIMLIMDKMFPGKIAAMGRWLLRKVLGYE